MAAVPVRAATQATKMTRRRDTVNPLARNGTAAPDVTSRYGGAKPMTPVDSVNAQVASCRRAQVGWTARPIRERLRFVRALRHSLVDAAAELTSAIHRELGR